MRGMLHHIDLTVKDPAASFALYDAVLGYMGYTQVRDFEWDISDGIHKSSVSLVEAKGAGVVREHDRYSPGLHHIAWRAENREDVDDFYELLKALDIPILDAPADYPQYNHGQGYYAVFFADPDGLKLEFAFTPN
jgi:glyoxylase I family protein